MARAAVLDTAEEAGRKSMETQARLINAVITVIFDQGYAGATMARIAAEAGVTRGAIQHHFGDKRVDLIAAACERVLDRRQAAYREYEGLTPQAQADISRTAMKAAYKDPETWFLIEVWIACKGDVELSERVRDVLQRVNDPVDLELMKHFAAAGHADDFRTIKYFYRSLTRGLAIEYSRKPDTALFDSVVDMAIDALEARRLK